jgi:hypothetical protein
MKQVIEKIPCLPTQHNNDVEELLLARIHDLTFMIDILINTQIHLEILLSHIPDSIGG